jgi:hypothetical protein
MPKDPRAHDDETEEPRDDKDAPADADTFDYGWEGSAHPDYQARARGEAPHPSQNYLEDREFSGKGGFGEDRYQADGRTERVHHQDRPDAQRRFDQFDDRAARGANGEDAGHGYGRDDRDGQYDDGRHTLDRDGADADYRRSHDDEEHAKQDEQAPSRTPPPPQPGRHR